MNKAAIKRMTRRTEFYMFIVLILLCIIVQIKSGGALFAFPGFFTKLNLEGEAVLSDKARRRFQSPENMAIYDKLCALSRETGYSVNALALAYLTCQPFDTYPITGASRVEQVLALREAGDAVLTPEQVEGLRSFKA